MPFTNTTVTGLRAWFDAAVGVTLSGSDVTVWADQSGNGFDVTPSGGNDSPTFHAGIINGLPGLLFDTTNGNAQLNSTFAGGITNNAPYYVVAVIKPTVPTVGPQPAGFSWGGPFGFINSNGALYYPVLGDYAGSLYVTGNDNFTPDPTAANTAYAYEWISSGFPGTLDLYLNGAAIGPGGYTSSADTGSSLVVGSDNGNGNASFCGYICELLIFDHVLSGGEVQEIHAYIQDKYAISLGITPTSISPTTATVAPSASQTFTGADGSGTGYVYSIAVNNSGGSINSSTGVYTAGTTGSVSDTVRVTDSVGGTADAIVTVTVGVGVSISPTSFTLAVGNSHTFVGSGGSGTGYVYSIHTNNSGGTINSSTGVYTAGTTGGVSDTVRVTDSLGGFADATVTVNVALAISPASFTLAVGNSHTFTGSHGSGSGYVYSIHINHSGGSINASTGVYTAGVSGGGIDNIRVTDSLGNIASASVTVNFALAIAPTSITLFAGTSRTFTVSHGSGSGYVYSIHNNNSGGSINASTGVYTAGSTSGVIDTIRVTDSLSNTADALAHVSAVTPISISPKPVTVGPHGSKTFVAAGGVTPYTYSLSVNNSGGSINSSTGAYTAGSTGSVTDTVQVTDVLNNTAFADVTVTSSVTTINDPLGHGAVNTEQAEALRNFLNPALKGKGWDSMIAALAVGDQRNADNARLAFDQLFLSSASGVYLDRRASDVGIHRPRGVNMSDNLFRQLALTQRNGKLTQKALLDVLEIFYGRDTTRASSDTAVAESYLLQDGDELVILFEERNTVTVTFERSHFSNIGAATAEEVAAAITRACRDAGNVGFAVSFTDSISGQNKVRIYSGTLGLTSSVRIVGGRGNLALLFPTPLFTDLGGPYATWNITFSPDTQGNLRFTLASGSYNLFQVQDGDLVYIYGPEFAASANGTFKIQAIKVTSSEKWFEIDNPLGEESASVVQTLFNDLVFFRPKRRTIYDNVRRVVVCENNGYLDIIIPATTEVVDRGPGLAAYLNEVTPILTDNPTLTRVDGVIYVLAGADHGLSVGDQVFIDGAYPDGSPPPIVPGTPSTDFPGADSTAAGTTAASVMTTMTQTGTYTGVYSKAVRTNDGRLLIVGGATTADGTTFVPLERITVLEKTSQVGGAVDFLWTQLSSTDGSHGFSGNNFGYRNFAVSLLMDGRVLCTGGSVGDDATGVAVAGYDLLTFLPPLAVSQQSGALATARAAHAQAPSTATDTALMCGGWVVNGVPLATTKAFSGLDDTWTSKASMKIARMHHGLVFLDANLVYLAIGGMTNLDGSTWIDSSDGVTVDLAGHGLTSAPGTTNRCETYNVFDDAWTMTGSMTYARANFGTVQLPDGRVIVFGGSGYLPQECVTAPSFPPYDLKSVEIYDPFTKIWSTLPSMQQARVNPVCTYMPATNEIWVTSGAQDKRTEVLDVATMRWRVSAQAQISAKHTNATGGLLGDDVFAVIGGEVAVNLDDGTFATDKVNDIVVPGSDKIWYAPGINAQHRVATVIDANKFTINTPDYVDGFTVAAPYATITPSKALPAPETVPGPFSYDPKTGFAITAIAGTTDTVFNKGVRYSSLHLTGMDSALAFPDEEGWLVFNFGYENVVGPIRYLGRLSDSDLILDAALPFSTSLPAGASVRLLSGRSPYEPAADHRVGNFYATGTAAGREAARNIIDDIIAAGKQVLVTVVYPGDHGLGAEGFPDGGSYKLSDKVAVWGGDNLDSEIPAARKGP